MRIILVHGAWHGGWCWQHLLPELTALGHQVEADDLPGHGADATPLAEVTMDSYVDAVCRQVAAADKPVLLVGHSMAGLVISAVAERMPERIARLVYLCAFLPKAGAGDSLQALSGLGGTAIKFTGGPTAGTVLVADDAIDQAFYADCPAERVAAARQRLTPQPLAPFAATPALGGNFAGVAKTYIECTLDRAIPLDLQRLLQERQACDQVLTLAASHSPFLSQPAELAAVLAQVARVAQ